MTRSGEVGAAPRAGAARQAWARPAPRVTSPAVVDRLNLVVVCDHAHVSGGLAQVAHASARALSRRGHRVILFAAVPPIDSALLAAGVEVVCLGQPDMLGDRSRVNAAGRALWNVAAYRRLTEVLGGLDPQNSVIHLHGWSKALSPSVLGPCRRSGVAMVHTLHDYVTVCPNGALFNYVNKENCGLRPMSAACLFSNCDARHYGHKLWRVARQFALIASGGTLDGQDVIYISEMQREILAPLLPATTNLHYVANPVDVRDHGPADVAASETFVFVGRLSMEKGATLFAEAVGRIGVNAKFVGDGPMRQKVLSAAPTVSVTGWLGNVDVVKHLRSARALIFPSLWYETFGLSVYEALANGVPPIVSDNTASAEVVEHGVNGLLFRSGNIDNLIAQIQTLRDRGIAERIGKTAYNRYWAHPPTLERHADRLEEIYRLLLVRRNDLARASTRGLPGRG